MALVLTRKENESVLIDGDMVRNVIEVAVGTDPNDPTDGDEAAELVTGAISGDKNVPALGALGMLFLALSMLVLSGIRIKRKSLRS
ncbi:DUF1705 domain-containing protein [Pseudomonadales bacterium]|nr:DUF1705 domain-containing protein [Pseudomonadales bacterium]